MKRRFKKQWESLGSTDPYWAVLASPSKMNRKWDKDVFFQTGVREISAVLDKVSGFGVGLNFGLALDYGCGVGRLCRALSSSFEKVIGVDFSSSMLTEAKAVNDKFKNIQFVQNSGKDISHVAEHSVDFLYSNIALQHAETGVQLLLLKEFIRVLQPGAVLVVQTPSHPNIRTLSGLVHLFLGNPIVNLAKMVLFGPGRVMEMHTVKKQKVINLFETEQMSILDIEKNNLAGKAFISYTYYAQKR